MFRFISSSRVLMRYVTLCKVESVRASVEMTPLVLHVWPGRWSLPSIDAGCLEAILFLQLAFPGLYSLVETANPDQSPSGQLPFLTHGHIVVSSLPSILSYLSSLDHTLVVPFELQTEYDISLSMINPNLDSGLSALQLSQRTAWRAYFEAQLGDLVVSQPVFSLKFDSAKLMLWFVTYQGSFFLCSGTQLWLHSQHAGFNVACPTTILRSTSYKGELSAAAGGCRSMANSQ